MAKIMLVEDDNNLREIYEARLLAEGYEIVSAKDGEEALALAVKEKPDLIISDVMMPKISGFDMLDILRSTPETKNTKVIMMTALSQAEDKTRADKLGADRYLVKSQVTLEDVAKVAKEVLTGETEAAPAPAEPVAQADHASAPAPEPVAAPAAQDPAPAPASAPVASEPVAAPVLSGDTANAQTTADEAAKVAEQINQFASAPASDPEPTVLPNPEAETPPAPIEVATAPVDSTEAAADNAEKLAAVVNQVIESNESEVAEETSGVSGKKVIAPINDLNTKPDLDKLAAEQDQKDNAMAAIQPPATDSVVTPEGTVIPPANINTSADQQPNPPAQPGDKIDPNSIAL